jgi:hypothetical protein
MTFSYHIDHTTQATQDVAKIRLAIGDTVEDEGPRPDGSNFSDEEITSIITDEGGDLGRAQAAMHEILSGAWASAPKTMFGSLIDPTRVSRDHMSRAKILRGQYGYATAAAGFSVQMVNPET